MSEVKVTIILTDAEHKRRAKFETNLEGMKKILRGRLDATEDKPGIPPRADLGD